MTSRSMEPASKSVLDRPDLDVGGHDFTRRYIQQPAVGVPGLRLGRAFFVQFTMGQPQPTLGHDIVPHAANRRACSQRTAPREWRDDQADRAQSCPHAGSLARLAGAEDPAHRPAFPGRLRAPTCAARGARPLGGHVGGRSLLQGVAQPDGRPTKSASCPPPVRNTPQRRKLRGRPYS